MVDSVRIILVLECDVKFERLVIIKRSMHCDAHPLASAQLQLRRRRDDVTTVKHIKPIDYNKAERNKFVKYFIGLRVFVCSSRDKTKKQNSSKLHFDHRKTSNPKYKRKYLSRMTETIK